MPLLNNGISLKRQKLRHNIQLDTDSLFMIFMILDAQTLLRCAITCKQYYAIYQSHQETYWKSLCFTKFKVSTNPDTLWQDSYKTRNNILNSSSRFISSKDDFNYTASSISYESPKHFDHLLFVWPCNSDFCYSVVYDNGFVCWVDQQLGPTTVIYVASISNVIDDQLTPEFSLDNHSHSIGLLLSNAKFKLFSFDEASNVLIWSLKTFDRIGHINTAPILEHIISMNVHEDRLIAGGVNSKVAIWDVNTLDLVRIIHDPLCQTAPMNVGIWENVAAFGCPDGQFFIYDIKGETRLINKFNILDEQGSSSEEYVPPLLGIDTQSQREEFNTNTNTNGRSITPEPEIEEYIPPLLGIDTQSQREEFNTNTNGRSITPEPEIEEYIPPLLGIDSQSQREEFNTNTNGRAIIPEPEIEEYIPPLLGIDSQSQREEFNTSGRSITPEQIEFGENQAHNHDVLETRISVISAVSVIESATDPIFDVMSTTPDPIFEVMSTTQPNPRVNVDDVDEDYLMLRPANNVQIEFGENQAHNHDVPPLFVPPDWQDIPEIEEIPFEHFPQGPEPFQIVPRTLALNSHILVTNGVSLSSIIVWDYLNGKQISSLSHPDELLRRSFSGSSGEIEIAELSPDGSIIYAGVDQEVGNRILVWDYAAQKRECGFKKMTLVGFGSKIKVWVATESKI